MRGFAFAAVALAVAGCSPKPPATPAAAPAEQLPAVEITPIARDVLVRVAAEQKFADWWVRLNVAWKPDPQIEVTVEKNPPGPADVVHAASGLRVIMAADQMPYLKGALIDVVREPDRIGFAVTFPYRTDEERRAANRWLVEQAEKRAK